MARWARLLLLLPLGGCSVALADAEGAAKSSEPTLCSTDEDCGEDGTCSQGTCVGGETSFATVLVEISVPNDPDLGAYAGTQFLQTLTKLPSVGGRRDLKLSEPTEVTLEVTPPPCTGAEGERVDREDGLCPEGSDSPRTCAFDLAATPLDVIFTPSEWALGVSTVRFTTRSECVGDSCRKVALQLAVPPGEYDVYLRPDPTVTPPDGTCAVVPEIFPLEVPADVQLTVPYRLTPASRLEVQVDWPLSGNESSDLENWTIDMLDGASGRRVSTVVALGEATVEGDTATYSPAVDYVSPSAAAAGSELVRLRPPEGELAPTLVMERAGLELFKGSAVIDQLTSLPETVQVEGQILARTSLDDTSRVQSVRGTVAMVATELEGMSPGVLASFRNTATAADSGDFQASLLPGRYRVRIVPPGDCSEVVPCDADELLCECPLGATEVTDFVVATEPNKQAGKAVELDWRTRVAGQVTAASGSPVDGADVLAIPVPQRSTALEVAVGAESFLPRASSGRSDASGRFELLADAGSYHLFVRPERETGLAWLVRPNVLVRAGGGSPGLEQLVLPLPVSYSGVVRVPGEGSSWAVVPRATIKAYVPVDSGDPSGMVVQVAESTTDDAGEFQLLLPTALEHEP